jgi:hypothetical protein
MNKMKTTYNKKDDRKYGLDLLGQKVTRGCYVVFPLSASIMNIGLVTRITANGYKVLTKKNNIKMSLVELQKYDNNVVLLNKDNFSDLSMLNDFSDIENYINLPKKLNML